MKTIVIFSQCVNPYAKGDFAFAISLACDLYDQVQSQNLGINIVLTSHRVALHHFEQLTTLAVRQRLSIEGRDIGLCAFETYDAVQHDTIAFIDANHCKEPEIHEILDILSPTGKVLKIGTANKSGCNALYKQLFNQSFMTKEPRLYQFLSQEHVLINNCGLNLSTDLGIPNLPPLPAATEKIRQFIPSKPYGFVYVNNVKDLTTTKDIVSQYLLLTDLSLCIVVGNYHALIGAFSEMGKEIRVYHRLDNLTMRHAMANTAGDLVVTTGINSTFEAWAEGKLSFYDTAQGNDHFIQSYFSVLEAKLAQSSHTTETRLLAQGLFFKKPLPLEFLSPLNSLFSQEVLRNELIRINRDLLTEATGQVALKLLQFITQPADTAFSSTQIENVCKSFNLTGTPIPIHEALILAAVAGNLFKLKVLLMACASQNLSIDIPDSKERTALHWAVIYNKTKCVDLLLRHGANRTKKDNTQKSPLDYASTIEIISLLLANMPLLCAPVQTTPSPVSFFGVAPSPMTTGTDTEVSSISSSRTTPFTPSYNPTPSSEHSALLFFQPNETETPEASSISPTTDLS